MKIALSSDHGGFEHKEKLRADLIALGYEVTDYGVYSDESQDYPDFIYPAVKTVASGENERAVIICGTGVGASIVANKVRGIRCALVTNIETARLTREHNNSNVLALAGRTTDYDTNLHITQIWLDTPFSDDARHQRRIDKIGTIENLEGRE